MSDLAILADSLKSSLLELAKQAQALGVGLRNAAPADKPEALNDTVHYLLQTADNLLKVASECGKLSTFNPSTVDNEKQKELLILLQEVVTYDNRSRAEHHIADKFGFIRRQLQALLGAVVESVSVITNQENVNAKVLSPDEQLVYVHLYNAQGLVLQSWYRMLMPAVYYEHSVNRPIYDDKSFINALIRSRGNATQHGFLTIAVNKNDILPPSAEGTSKDANGNSLIKVKEGALKAHKTISFTHNDCDYYLDSEGALKKINDCD